MSRLTRRGMLLVAFVGLGASSCLAPTLPLPPPERPQVEGPDSLGNVRLSGTAPESGSVVYALNQRTNQIFGQRTTTNSTYLLSMPAQTGDYVSFWYTADGQQSPTILFQIGDR